MALMMVAEAMPVGFSSKAERDGAARVSFFSMHSAVRLAAPAAVAQGRLAVVMWEWLESSPRMLPLQVQQCLNDGLAVTLVVMYGYAPGGDGESAGHWVVLHKAGQGEHATVVVDDHEGHAQAAVVAALALERGGVWRTLCGSPGRVVVQPRHDAVMIQSTYDFVLNTRAGAPFLAVRVSGVSGSASFLQVLEAHGVQGAQLARLDTPMGVFPASALVASLMQFGRREAGKSTPAPDCIGGESERFVP